MLPCKPHRLDDLQGNLVGQSSVKREKLGCVCMTTTICACFTPGSTLLMQNKDKALKSLVWMEKMSRPCWGYNLIMHDCIWLGAWSPFFGQQKKKKRVHLYIMYKWQRNFRKCQLKEMVKWLSYHKHKKCSLNWT